MFILSIVLLSTVYLATLAVYRLYLCPVAHVPGPFLAKLTYWYEFYYDVLKKGRYVFHIQKLHQEYGPILRINPAEVHINDGDFYDELYTGASKKRDKWDWFCNSFGIPDASFTTVKHDVHRMRRAAMNPYFSKQKVRALQPQIEKVVQNLLARFDEFTELQKPLIISLAFAALTNDVAEQYALGRNDNRVQAPDFDPSFHDAGEAGGHMGHLTKQMPWILTMMNALPDFVAVRLDPNMLSFIKLQRDIKDQVTTIQNDKDNLKYTTSETPTVFHAILSDPHLPDHEKSASRLWQDGQIAVTAGTLTTASAMTHTLYSLLTQPETLRELKSELQANTPDPDSVPPLTKLENLPYLTACIQEGLRLSNGVTCRLQRIDPDNAMVFTDKLSPSKSILYGKQYSLPAGTPVSMTGMLVHFSELYFPDPYTFDPSRWLASTNQAIRPEKYLVPFTRGTRQCLGINLAYAEIYLTLAMIFRTYGSKDVRFDGDRGWLELTDTVFERDLEIKGDGIVPIYSPERSGVKILVKK